MALPTVTSVAPNTVNTLGNVLITVGGTGFSLSPVSINLTIGSNSYGPYAAQVSSDTLLTFNAPPLSLAGVYEVRVTNGTGQSVANPPLDQLTYSYPLEDGATFTSPNYYWDPFANYSCYGQWTFTQPILLNGGIFSVLPISTGPVAPPLYYVIWNSTTNQFYYYS